MLAPTKTKISILLFALSFVSNASVAARKYSSKADPTQSVKEHPILDFTKQPVIKSYYDGKTDDLLTAGWSYQQLNQRIATQSTSPIDAQSIRKLAYFNNITALLDTTESGGYGRLFGPDKHQKPVSGYEYLTYSVNTNGVFAASLLLQIPDDIDTTNPCLIVAASSGSRGIYGAVGTVGMWALTHQCAVAYTDKGTGTGFYFFDDQSGYDVQGNYLRAKDAKQLIFNHPLNNSTNDFVKRFPTAISVKQAYSTTNVEKDFGQYVIQAAQFGLFQLNQHFTEAHLQFNKKNTLIIAASISNGGGASLRAVEMDDNNLFDGVVVAEPNIYPRENPELEIQLGGSKVVQHSLPGYQYFIFNNLYAPCALLTAQAQLAPYASSDTKRFSNWCENLKQDGFLSTGSTAEQAQESQNKLMALGLSDHQQTMSPINQAIALWPALAMTYSNQLGRFNIEDNICGMYFSYLNKKIQADSLDVNARHLLFANSNGIPPTAGINLVSTDSSSTVYQQAKCFYQLSQQPRLKTGVSELIATGDLRQTPTIIIHGRDDALIAPNHTSRPYYADSSTKKSNINKENNIRYYEISNAQHFDAFLSLPQFADKYIPLHYYFEQSLDLMLTLLRDNQPLPPSQLVKTQTRKKVAESIEPLSKNNLPEISATPSAPIILRGNKLIIPE